MGAMALWLVPSFPGLRLGSREHARLAHPRLLPQIVLLASPEERIAALLDGRVDAVINNE